MLHIFTLVVLGVLWLSIGFVTWYKVVSLARTVDTVDLLFLPLLMLLGAVSWLIAQGYFPERLPRVEALLWPKDRRK